MAATKEDIGNLPELSDWMVEELERCALALYDIGAGNVPLYNTKRFAQKTIKNMIESYNESFGWRK